VGKKYLEYWDGAEKTFPFLNYPNVTMGWDSSPRANQSDPSRQPWLSFHGHDVEQYPREVQSRLGHCQAAIATAARRPTDTYDQLPGTNGPKAVTWSRIPSTERSTWKPSATYLVNSRKLRIAYPFVGYGCLLITEN